MNKKAIRLLEFDKIRSILSDNAVSSLGKDLALSLEPSSVLIEIKERLAETTEASKLLMKKGSIPLDGIKDIRSSLTKAKKGAMLEPFELLNIADCLRIARRLKKFINEDKREESYPILEELIDSLNTFNTLEDKIYRCIISEEEISDNASSLLGSIRRKIKEKNFSIREKLNTMITSSHYQKYLQESIITLRGDRFVIPVKQEYRSSIQGLIHDQSASGATLFIEPIAVVEMNNDLKQLKMKEQEEIIRILEELSTEVMEKNDYLNINTDILASLDFIFCKAKFCHNYRCSEPIINNEGRINIIKARHLLLDQKKVVPINIELGERFNTLVITGPNTGGKTVTLKTLGLIILMAQAGLHIPADDYSEIAVFEEVYADIGDEQSIEQSLSTFSSHMTNIVSILENLKPNSLVLFDELGAGTDPTEGAALAISILKLLHNKNIRTVATTHYSELKVYALSTDGVSNACVEFDVETLRPTYRLLIGIPGKSNAFEISRKLGLSDDIINSAKEMLSQDDIRFEDIIQKLENDVHKVKVEYDSVHSIRVELEKQKDEYNKKNFTLKTQTQKILDKAHEEAFNIVKNAKKEADILIKELREAINEEASKKAAMVEAARNKVRELETQVADELKNNYKHNININAPKDLNVGDYVKILDINQKGYAVTKPDADGNLTVKAGIMKINVNIKNLQLIKEDKNDQIISKYRQINTQKVKSLSTQVDVRGQNLEEALNNIDKYLDDAYLGNIGQVTIIHGKGTGILRSGIIQFLRSHSHIKSYRSGGYNEGGIGVTIVELK